MKKHNYIIDTLRFFASFMVVLFHLNVTVHNIHNWYRNVIGYGSLGVPVFFVISGYCIIASAENTPNTADFFVKRFFRIFPPYWVSLVLVLVAAIFQRIYFGSNSVQNIPKNLPQILATIALFTSPFTSIITVTWVAWTLTCELIFYILIGLIMLVKKKVRIFFIIGISLISAVCRYQHTGYLFFLDHWPAFGFGLCIYYFFNIQNKTDWLPLSLLFAINLYSLWHKYLGVGQPEYIFAVFVAFFVLISSHFVKYSNNFFSKLGQHSYSVYLIHVPIGVFLLGRFKTETIQHVPAYNLTYDLLVFIFVSIVAWQMFNWIERPSMNYGKKVAAMHAKSIIKIQKI